MRTQLKLSVISLFVAAVTFLAAVFMAELTDINVYGSFVVITLLALLGLATLVSCFSKRWLTIKGVGFLVCHLAVVLLLLSAFTYYVLGTSGYMNLIVGGQGSRVVYDADSGISCCDLDYTLNCTDFDILYHPYVYTYAVVEKNEWKVQGSADLTEDGLKCGNKGTIPYLSFINEYGELKTQVLYDNILATWDGNQPKVKRYVATVEYSDGGKAEISVNNPTTHRGHKIYLMSYDFSEQSGQMCIAVRFQVKRDVALPFAIMAFILLPIGTFMLCLRPRKTKTEGGSRT